MRRLRTLFVAILVVGMIGCSSESSDPGDDPDDPSSPDAGGDIPEPETGFQVVTPPFDLAPGEEATWCYYTTLPNAAEAGVTKWESSMTAGSHHMIMYSTTNETQPDGTLVEDCDLFGGGLDAPVWTYAAQTPTAEFPMPAGVGMTIIPNQPVIIQMHYLNASDQALTPSVTINAHLFEAGATYDKAAAFVTYNTQISVPAGMTGTAGGTCQTPSGAKFFTMSSHSHQFSTETRISDGQNMIVQSTDWEHPEVVNFAAAPFLEMTSGSLTYECDYFNYSNQTVQTGDSAETDEMCMAVGYFFPADKPVFCVNSFVVPL